jgi:ribosomal protein S18 acetylase RimI-like enzyme
MSAERVTLRPVTEADQDFLLAAYASTRAAEMAMVPWSAEQKDAFVKSQFAAQAHHYAAEYPQASHEVICCEGVAAGRLYLDRRAQELHILDVIVLPQFRHTGIGSCVLRQILDEASVGDKAVTIYVESFNPSLNLFRKLGFQLSSQDGFQCLLRWLPDGPAAGA